MDQGIPAINAPKRRLGRSLTTTKARPAPVEAVALRHSPITAPGTGVNGRSWRHLQIDMPAPEKMMSLPRLLSINWALADGVA
jgi:hypothetical protein